MEVLAIIQIVAVILPYFIKILEQAESLEEVQEFARIVKKLLDDEDMPKLLDLIEKIK